MDGSQGPVRRAWRRLAVTACAAALPLGAAAAVTGAVAVGTAAPAGAATDVLYVDSAASPANATCTEATPCSTIEKAVLAAEGLTGDVTVEVAQGTYAEQVTVPPTTDADGAYAPTGLTIEPNPANTAPVLVQPTALSVNLPGVPATGQIYDDFGSGGADVSAIVGVGAPGTGDTYETGFSTSVTISGLSIAGGDFDTWVAGVAYVNASGTIAGNAVDDVTTDQSSWSANLAHGIDVRGANPGNATTPRATPPPAPRTGPATSRSTSTAPAAPPPTRPPAAACRRR
jgi:hypothetical protein